MDVLGGVASIAFCL